LLGNVSDNILDGPHLILFTIMVCRIAALVDDGAQLFCPLTSCLKRPYRRFANSDEALTITNAIDEDE